MITIKNKLKLFFITFTLNCFLIYIYFNQKLVEFDKIFIECIFFIHTLLFFALYHSYYKLIDILHVCLFLSIGCFFLIDSFQIKFLLLGLMITIKLLWIWENNQCILNTKGTVFHGIHNKIFHTFTFIYYSVCCLFLRK